MKRIRSNKRDRGHACIDLQRVYQARTPNQQDIFGNPVSDRHDTLRVSPGIGYYQFWWVKEDIAVMYCPDSNSVEGIKINSISLSCESPRYDTIANRVYKLIDNQVLTTKASR